MIHFGISEMAGSSRPKVADRDHILVKIFKMHFCLDFSISAFERPGKADFLDIWVGGVFFTGWGLKKPKSAKKSIFAISPKSALLARGQNPPKILH